MGDISEHFSLAEFRCHGHGVPGHVAHATIVDLELVGRLELLRHKVGRPLYIVSGHRCRWWNARVGGASASQHLPPVRGADIPSGYATVAQAASVGFKGIGRRRGWAVHVDTRARPARWSY